MKRSHRSNEALYSGEHRADKVVHSSSEPCCNASCLFYWVCGALAARRVLRQDKAGRCWRVFLPLRKEPLKARAAASGCLFGKGFPPCPQRLEMKG